MYKDLIAIAQIDSVSGDFKNNALKVINYIKMAVNYGVSLVVFPQNTLSGNLIDDVIKKYPYLKNECEKWLNGISSAAANITVILGYINNSVAVIENGEIKQIINEFPALYNNICITSGEIIDSDFAVILNNTSGNDVATIHSYASYTASKFNFPVVYVNSVGSTDNVSYVGSSSVFNVNGDLILRAKAFEEQLISVKFSQKGEINSAPFNTEETDEFSLNYENDLERVYKTIIQGIRCYFKKCGLTRAVLGLSGGLDSSVCAVLLSEALGKENVLGISMPSKITSSESKNDAKQLADNLGIYFEEAPIKPMVGTAYEYFKELFSKINWSGRYLKSYTLDNIQARLRAMFLFGVSNEFSSCIPIATSDKSESYMGYATINGDMSGGFAPIADVTKTKLFALAKWINQNIKNVIPQSIIEKRPGAELAIDPKTGKPLAAEDALMPYEFLDEVIWRIENKRESYNEMLNSTFLYEKNNTVTEEQKSEWLNKFFQRMSSALFKWSIAVPSVILDDFTINKSVYYQPITSGRISYKTLSQDEIINICKQI